MEQPSTGEGAQAALFQFNKLAAEAGYTAAQHSRHTMREYIITIIRREGFHQSRSAEALGWHRNTLSRRNRELKINIRQERQRFEAEQAKKQAASVKATEVTCRKTS